MNLILKLELGKMERNADTVGSLDEAFDDDKTKEKKREEEARDQFFETSKKSEPRSREPRTTFFGYNCSFFTLAVS